MLYIHCASIYVTDKKNNVPVMWFTDLDTFFKANSRNTQIKCSNFLIHLSLTVTIKLLNSFLLLTLNLDNFYNHKRLIENYTVLTGVTTNLRDLSRANPRFVLIKLIAPNFARFLYRPAKRM